MKLNNNFVILISILLSIVDADDDLKGRYETCVKPSGVGGTSNCEEELRCLATLNFYTYALDYRCYKGTDCNDYDDTGFSWSRDGEYYMYCCSFIGKREPCPGATGTDGATGGIGGVCDVK